MSATDPTLNSAPIGAKDVKTPSPAGTLRKLFLTLFLRGQSARGLKKDDVPKSVGRKLLLAILAYGAFGCIAFMLLKQPLFFLSAYLHAMTFAFLGMFVAGSAGELLFNQAETDILLHRPIEPRTLLWAKVWVLVEVSLWIAGAFNLAGLAVGVMVPNGCWLFPLVHAGSTVLQAVFCTSCVVLAYQLCLRWLGRERLEAIMVTTQVVISVAVVLGSQLLPRLLADEGSMSSMAASAWWIALVPPAWFAGIDDALAGSSAASSWLLAGIALAGTALVVWLAFGKLAESYQAGLQTLNERTGDAKQKQTGRWLHALVERPPLRWWLRDPVERASFLLTAAYLLRDRETKLRVYPGIAPFLAIPVIFLVGGRGAADNRSFGIAVSCAYLSLVPMLGASMLSYSQHWLAADLFRVAPIAGPGRLCDGARRAVLFCLTAPLMLAFGVVAWGLVGASAQLFLLLPGLIVLPVFALIPSLDGRAVPLSKPGDDAKAATRGLSMMAMMVLAMAVGGLGVAAWYGGVFWWFVLLESVVAGAAYWAMRRVISQVPWASAE